MIMKKVIFLMAIVGVYCVSCTSSKKSISETSKIDYYRDNPYAQPFIHDEHLISGDKAAMYISKFKHHKYKTFKKKTLNNAFSTFNPNVLDYFAKKSDEVSIFFKLAAFGKTGKSVPKDMDSSRHPFIIMEVRTKLPISATGKGSAESSASTLRSLFFMPVQLCPPPNTGCRIP
jgi:hypothetical protein